MKNSLFGQTWVAFLRQVMLVGTQKTTTALAVAWSGGPAMRNGTPDDWLSFKFIRAGKRRYHEFNYHCGKEARADRSTSWQHKKLGHSARAR
jgi:hypothetical protein